MCCDCSLVNEEQQIYVEKSEDVHGLFWSCQTCIVNKLDVLTELKKIKEQLEQDVVYLGFLNIMFLNGWIQNVTCRRTCM